MNTLTNPYTLAYTNPSSPKLQKYIPPIYDGHNTIMAYRPLGLLPVAILGYELIKSQTVLLVRYRYPGSGLHRSVPYKPLSPNTVKFFLYTVPFYIAFDVFHKNYRYTQDKSLIDKIAYSTDLILFHLLATCYLPYKIVSYSALRIPVVCSYIVRYNMPLLMLSTAVFVMLGSLQVKVGDIATDFVLDYSFRQLYDFKKSGGML